MHIYLDNSATTKPLDKAISACVFAMEHEYGNPSSLHKMGFEAEKLLISAKTEIANALSCQKDELLFLSGATEANNLAIFGAAKAAIRRGNKIITTAIEHPSVLEPMNELAKQGFEVVYLKPDENGRYTPEMFENQVDEKTILVSTMWVNNEMGMVLPINEIGDAIKRKNPNVIYHVDGVQGFLKLPIKLKGSNIDLMPISGHKAYAPKGIGALFVKAKLRLVPTVYGGGQQNGLRSGTESVPLISAFGAAVCEQKSTYLKKAEYYSELKAYFKDILSDCSDISFFEDGIEGAEFAPHILSLFAKGIKSEVLLHFLESYDIFVSSGSACARGKKSHVLSEFQLSNSQLDTAIRISFGTDTTKSDLDEFKIRLLEAINRLTKIK